MIKTIFATSSSLLVWFLTSALVHPLPHTISDRARTPLLTGAMISPPVAGVFERSCANCHSEKTHWPWYSQLAPMSWMVENDVKEARKHLNLSRWDLLDPDEQRLALTSIAKEIESGEMPPQRYVVIHPEARLSTEAAAQVIEWARTERHRLKLPNFPDASRSPSRGSFPLVRESSVLRQIKSE
jgi:heme-binding protein